MAIDLNQLDRINQRILNVLQTRARISNQDLADDVGLSPSACLMRVRRLEDSGLIRRYVTDVDVDKLGSTLSAFVEITLKNHDIDDFKHFDKAMQDQAEVIASYKVSGRFDYLLMVVVRDMARLRVLSDELLESDLGIAKFTTVPVIEQPKLFSGYPIDNIISQSQSAE